jgi:hypothetical protein
MIGVTLDYTRRRATGPIRPTGMILHKASAHSIHP